MDFEDRAPFQKQESVARLFWSGQPLSDPRFYVNFVCCQSSIGRLWLFKFRRGMARVHISSSFVRLWRAYSNYWVWVAFWKSCWTHLDVSCASCGYWLWIVVWAGSVCANWGIFRNIEDRWCYLDLGLSSSCCIAYLEPETIGQQSLATCFSHVAICSQEVWSGEFGWSRLLQSPMHWDRRISERNVDYCLLYLRQALIGSAHGSFWATRSFSVFLPMIHEGVLYNLSSGKSNHRSLFAGRSLHYRTCCICRHLGHGQITSFRIYIHIHNLYLYVYIYTHISIYLSIYLSIHPSIYLSIYLSVCLPGYLSIYLSFYLSNYLTMKLFMYLPTSNISIYLIHIYPYHTYLSTLFIYIYMFVN